MEERESHESDGGVVERVSAGLQAGTLAGLAMLAWIMTGAWVQGQSFWTIPNLLAYTFHGSRMYRPDFVQRTWSGLAFHLCCAAVLGVVFALLLPRTFRPGSAAVFGAMYSLALYAIAGVWLWDRINAPMQVYARQPFMLAGYVLYGLLLGSVPVFHEPLIEPVAPSALPPPWETPSEPPA